MYIIHSLTSYYGSFEMDGVLMIEMEYADGGTLSEYLVRRKTNLLPERQILEIFLQMTEAIQCIHQRNILHRYEDCLIIIFYPFAFFFFFNVYWNLILFNENTDRFQYLKTFVLQLTHASENIKLNNSKNRRGPPYVKSVAQTTTDVVSLFCNRQYGRVR